MKQFKHKKLLAIGGLGLGVVLLSSCTANFCSNVDKASMAYPYEQGVTVYVTKAEYERLKADEATKALIEKEENFSAAARAIVPGFPSIAGPAFVDESGVAINDAVYKYVPYTGKGDSINFTAEKSKAFLNWFLGTASSNGYSLPSLYYYSLIDDYVLKAATTEYLVRSTFAGHEADASYVYASSSDYAVKVLNDASVKAKVADILVGYELTDEQIANPKDTYIAVNPYREVDPEEYSPKTEINIERSILRKYGNIKFTGYNAENNDRPLFGHLKGWNEELRALTGKGIVGLGSYDVPGLDFFNYYSAQMVSKVDAIRSCIATRADYFGHYGSTADWRVAIEQKDWGYAWGKGFLEGLLVYPVTWVLDSLAYGMDPALTGAGQILALIIVTLIVRGLLLAVSWRTTLDNQKMQALQPELAKLQQKYPNANTNQAEKQRMNQEQMMLYRRNGIKPFRQIIVMIVQFPVFICVWAGLQGSAALSTGEFLNMRLSDNINTILFNTHGTWYANTYGWWTALILFILMAATQVMAMLLPRIIAKQKQKKVTKMNAAPAATQSGNTLKWMSYGMIAFTIIMGFFLPSAMGVYWLIGGLISVVQTLITQAIMSKPKKAKDTK
ncbi:MAG: membrane protein insertase YidC [Bacilli bacterium]|nr:membrane protein insertase YidC [Bacilli bacterium]